MAADCTLSIPPPAGGPAVTQLNPTSAAPGAPVVISGTNLSNGGASPTVAVAKQGGGTIDITVSALQYDIGKHSSGWRPERLPVRLQSRSVRRSPPGLDHADFVDV